MTKITKPIRRVLELESYLGLAFYFYSYNIPQPLFLEQSHSKTIKYNQAKTAPQYKVLGSSLRRPAGHPSTSSKFQKIVGMVVKDLLWLITFQC